MNLIMQLPETASNILLLLVVVAIKLIQGRFTEPNSNGFFHFYCQQLANKVNKDHHSINHKKIAGLIATMITFVPVVIILWLFEDFIAVPWLWHAMLLYFAFGPLTINTSAKTTAKHLAEQDKYQAKKSLAPYVLRDTEQLSSLGLAKASIEMLLLKTFQQQLVVAFYFLCFGPLAAFSYRLLLEMHYSWNIKHSRFRAFGYFVNQVVALLLWLPNRLFLCALILTSLNPSSGLYWRLVKQHFFKLNQNIIVAYFAYCLGIQLGGVAMYNQQKLRRIKFNEQARQPEAKHIILAIKQLNLLATLLLGLLISILVMLAILVNTN